ncbi:hypothetical protein EC991_003889 [Linnemannia zychae]|nr:hypothetical protein EC991_003889 [Linnemannia zychae]
MTLIRPVANFLGPTPYLANTIVVFMHPARTVGSQLEVTLFSIIGAILATAWIIPCQVSVAAYNRQFFAKHGTLDADGHMSWLIEAVWFFFGIWIMTALKARYAKLTYTFLFFTIANIFGYSKTNDNVKFNIHAYWNLVGPMLIGVGICLLVSIVFWPETASEGLGRALNESLDTSRALLNLSTRSFLLNHKTIALPKSVIENAQKEVRDAQKKLFSAYREARYEVTFATTDPADYKEVRVVVSALMRHLGSMSLVVQNERLLMLGHPDRENDDLETDSEEESDLAGSGETSSDTDHSVSDTDTDIRGSWDQGSTSGKSTASDYMAGDRRRGRPRKHKRGSAAELRRIRQLLMRAEMSTDALLQAQKAQDEEKGLQEGARPYHLGDNVLGSATAPSTPGGSGSRGRRSSIFEKYSLSRFSTGSGDIMGRTGSPGTERITTSIAQYPVSPSTPTHDSQHSRRPSSPQGDRGNSHPEGFISQQSGISTETFKPTLLPSHNKPSPRNVDRSVKLQGSGTVGAMNPTSGVDMILGTSPISGLPSSPSIDKRSRAHSDGGAGVRSNVDESLKKIPSRYSVSGSFSGHRVHKTMGSNRGKRRKDAKGATKPAKRKAKKEPKRKKEEEVKDIPPKEVAFGDRRLFLSFLDVVRDPLQRLSDSCSRSMASIERELVIGLNVEKDMKERLRKRNSHRDAIVRRAATATAEGNPLQKVTPPSTSDLHPSSEDASIGNGSSQHRQSLWQRVRHRIGVSSHPLTQGELDFMDVVRGTTEKEKKHKVSKSGIPADGIHPRKLQQHSTAVESLGDCMEEAEGSSILPGDISCVQYLTQELGIFDQAEASGLRGFIASNPTLDVGPREEIFLVFFYIFALREIARELLRLGSHLEEMKRKQEIQMELDGRKKPRRRLWWPKVIGNFEHWFSWGSYSQTRATEGFSGMVMRSTKNLERRQPRLIAEEKAHIEAKAAKAAEQEAKRVALENARREEMDWRDRLRRGRNPESWNTSKPRRSVTMSAFMSRPAGPPGDLEVGMTRLAPQPGRSSPLSSRLGRVRAWTFLSPSNKRTDTPLDAPQGDISVHPLSTDTSRSAMEASGYQDGPKTGNESHLQGRYTVVDIPEFQSLHPNPTYDNNSDTSASSSKMNTIQPRATTPSEVNPLDADETLERTLEPPSPSQRRPSQVPLLKVTYDGQSDDNDDSEDSSFEKDVGMGYKKQPPRKRTQSAFAEVSSRYSGHDSGLSEKPKEKHRYREPTPKSAPTPPPPPPAFVNVPKPRSMRYRIWEFLQEFESDEVRYGLKMASALTFVGLWAWLGWTYQILATDRGQWVMMTIVAVLSPTIGATFSVCAWRVGGTLAGILWAMLTYLAHPRDPFVILAMMPVITYCILISTHPTMGVIMMLSYNSIIFGVYHGRTNDNIYVTCYKVAITMIIGILISVALNTFLWPVLARRELRKEIALLIGRQGVLFAELVNKYLLEEQAPREIQQPDEKTDSSSERSSKDKDGVAWTEEDEKSSVKESLQPSSMGSELVTGSGRKVSRQHISDSSHRQDRNLLDGESHHSSDEYKLDADQLAFQHVEHQLQTKLIKICQLLDLSASEPRLKEDFPGKLYKQIVQCCQNILDRMVSMRMAAQLLSTEVRYLVTGPMNYYRRDMVGALLLYFSVLSSSLASKTALPPYLPSARMARLRVIYNVRQAIAAHQAETGEDHYTYIYYYAFSSALEEVIEELELLAILIKPLVGVTLVSSSEGHPCGVSADQLSLGSAIPSIQMPVPSLQPGAGTAAVLPADGGSDLRFGLGTGIMQAPGPSSGILTGSGNTSEQAQSENNTDTHTTICFTTNPHLGLTSCDHESDASRQSARTEVQGSS